MLNKNIQITLASKSPRRRKLLKSLGLKFRSISVDLNEDILDGEHPILTVKRLSLHKLELAKNKIKSGIIITADTIVVLNKEIIGKPKNEKDAFNILKNLSGKTHIVYTGFAIENVDNQKKIIDYEKTKVTFRVLSDDEINEYIKSGSPMDKAGAYGIQDDYGALFVSKINGCYYNVVGLPLQKLFINLKKII
ncbi:MAG: Maf family protein [Stygiobacter sp.]|jgi:septum formation protein|uniref:dTTP/UTP pyrophosphatase n=1 Tax=Stygiobacter electus TaxID=3032292 RepID=A0AAE3TED8_9BACT|nr:Maf family protein [Stygiobacter electus]MDF1612168.1 Maf family protein [Stygiobacter electus]